jgi:hypothetical protein
MKQIGSIKKNRKFNEKFDNSFVCLWHLDRFLSKLSSFTLSVSFHRGSMIMGLSSAG